MQWEGASQEQRTQQGGGREWGWTQGGEQRPGGRVVDPHRCLVLAGSEKLQHVRSAYGGGQRVGDGGPTAHNPLRSERRPQGRIDARRTEAPPKGSKQGDRWTILAGGILNGLWWDTPTKDNRTTHAVWTSKPASAHSLFSIFCWQMSKAGNCQSWVNDAHGSRLADTLYRRILV